MINYFIHRRTVALTKILNKGLNLKMSITSRYMRNILIIFL